MKNKDLVKENRIDYKIVNSGLSYVTDSELLSVLIGEPTPNKSSHLLIENAQSLNNLSKLDYLDLRQAGITHLKAICLMASFELGRRRRSLPEPEANKMRSSRDIHDLMYHIGDLNHEEFHVVYMNRANNVIRKWKLSQGGINGTVTDTRLIMRKALQLRACSIALCHNHPSGNKEPSDADKRITTKIKDAATLFDITVIDHIIITSNGYYSFADNGGML